MNPATIIREAQAEGVRLALSPTGTIKATGDGAVVNRWLGVIRERKAEIIVALKVGAGDTAPASQLAVPMTADQEQAVRAWLALIEEPDPAIIDDVVSRCREDAEALAYFTRRADEGLRMMARERTG